MSNLNFVIFKAHLFARNRLIWTIMG